MAKRVTDEERVKILSMREQGMTYKAIGLEIGRGRTTVASVCDPKYKAYAKAYGQSPERKEKQKARRATPEYKAYAKEYNQRPEQKAYMKAYRHTPRYKDARSLYMKEYKDSKEFKESRKKYRESPKGKATIRAYEQSASRKAHRSAYGKEYWQRPEVKAANIAYNQSPGRIAYRQSQRHKDLKAAYGKEYRQRPEVKAAREAYQQSPEYKAFMSDYQRGPGRLAHNLRSRLTSAIYSDQAAGGAIDDLGCTIDELREYLELQFKPGMSWDNWALDGWHIDHIRPLASFDLTDRAQFLEACHYTNLQPLWAEENWSKGDRLDVDEHKITDNGGD